MANGTTTALPMRLVWGARRAELQFGRASNQSFATYASVECSAKPAGATTHVQVPGATSDPMMIENCRWRVRTHPEPTYPNGGGLRRRPQPQ
jgi:hypothetical protein